MTDYAKLRELAQNATPGPWIVTWAPEYVHDEDRDLPLTIEHPLDVCRSVLIVDDDQGQALNATNAEFIAAANPTMVLALLDEIDALRRGQGSAPAPAAAGAVPVALHEAHPIPDSTATDTA